LAYVQKCVKSKHVPFHLEVMSDNGTQICNMKLTLRLRT